MKSAPASSYFGGWFGGSSKNRDYQVVQESGDSDSDFSDPETVQKMEKNKGRVVLLFYFHSNS